MFHFLYLIGWLVLLLTVKLLLIKAGAVVVNSLFNNVSALRLQQGEFKVDQKDVKTPAQEELEVQIPLPAESLVVEKQPTDETLQPSTFVEELPPQPKPAPVIVKAKRPPATVLPIIQLSKVPPSPVRNKTLADLNRAARYSAAL